MERKKTLEEVLQELDKKLSWLVESKELAAEGKALESEGSRNVR